MNNTFTLQKFDDNFEDFWDSEKGVFVIYAGKLGDVFDIKTELCIKDYSNTEWNCWLKQVKYVPDMGVYELQYKPY